MRLLSIALICLVACDLNTNLTPGRCDDGRLCEFAAWCVPGGGCEPPADCFGAMDGTDCEFGAEPGRCNAGQCEPIPAACDGAAIDPGEECDGAPVACASLDGFQIGVAECRNCILDVETCQRIGWTEQVALPVTSHPRTIWADGGVVWFGTVDGLWRLDHHTLALFEAGVWPHVAGFVGGDALALSNTGELLRIPREGEVTRLQVTDAPRSLTVVDGDIFVGGIDEVRRASTGFAAEAAPEGDVLTIYNLGGSLHAAGGQGGAGRLWRYDGTEWAAISIPGVPTVSSLSSTNGTLELGTVAGWYRFDGMNAILDETRPGTRATTWATGRLLWDTTQVAPVAYVDPAGLIATIESPSSGIVATAAFDAETRMLWIVDRAGQSFSHSGIDLGRIDPAGVVGIQRLGTDLVVGFDRLGSATPYLTVMPGNGLTAAMPATQPAIAIGTSGLAAPLIAHISLDAHHHFVSCSTTSSSTTLVFDTTTGAAFPKFYGGPAGIQAFAERAGEVIGVGLGGSMRFTGKPGVLTWAPLPSGLGEGVDLRAAAATPDGFVAVGANGAMFTLPAGGTTWTAIDTGTNADLAAVHVLGAETFAAGAGGTIVHCVAGACLPMSSGVTGDLTDLDGVRRDDVFAVGGGEVLHFDGTTWQRIAVAGFAPDAVAVSSSTVWLGQREGTQRGLYQLLRVVR